jgi:hypothetical protein
MSDSSLGLGKPEVDLTVLLTVYKRKTLGLQLKALEAQSVRPKNVVVYHDESYRKIPKRRLIRRGLHVTENSFNTKFLGRFAYLINAPTEWVTVLDDDIIPGRLCLENYLSQAEATNGIIGGMGRIARTNPQKQDLVQPSDVGVRTEPVLVDFVGHMWLFRKEQLFDMFAFPPVTYQTGEDMHLCFSSKLRSGISSYAAGQKSDDESCDVSMNKYAADEHAAYLNMPKSERESVEHYFAEKGLKFITPREQQEFAETWAKRS